MAELKLAEPGVFDNRDRRLHSLCAVAELKHWDANHSTAEFAGLHSLCAVAELKRVNATRIPPTSFHVSTAFVPWPN